MEERHPLSLFANHCYGKSLDVYVDCDTYQAKDKKVTDLDVSAACNSEKQEIIINVVNRLKDNVVETQIQSQYGTFNDQAKVFEVNGKAIKDTNSMTQQSVKTKTREINVKGESFSYSFPSHSFAMIIVSLEKKSK